MNMVGGKIDTEPSRDIKSCAEVIGNAATDPTEIVSTREERCGKEHAEQEQLLEAGCAEEGTTTAKIDDASSETQPQNRWTGFGAVFRRNLRGLFRWGGKKTSARRAKPGEESKETEEEEVTEASGVEIPTSDDRKPVLKDSRRPPRVAERQEYAEFSEEYMKYVRRRGFRY